MVLFAALVAVGAVVLAYLARCVGWPAQASDDGDGEGHDFYRLLQGFAAFNPHASFRYTAGRLVRKIAPTDASWRKWLPTQRPSPHWYDLGRFRSLVAGKLAAARRDGARRQTVRDFIAQNFCGLTGTVVRGELLRSCGLEGATLEHLAPGGSLDDLLLAKLLRAMKENARPVKPQKLGVVGKAHLAAAVVSLFGARPPSARYSAAAFTAEGVPYVLEVAFGFATPEEVPVRVTVAGVNWSPSPRCPFLDMGPLLGANRIEQHDPCVLIAHLACPRPGFLDTGKTVLDLPPAARLALRECFTKVTALWKKAKQRAEREDARRERLEEREIREALRQEKAGFLSIKAACQQVMRAAYREASGEGTRPANARQIMYAARRLAPNEFPCLNC
jgi:hypothetical protein